MFRQVSPVFSGKPIVPRRITCRLFAAQGAAKQGDDQPGVRDHTADEYQFLQKSEIPTYHFQKSLRRLPIPKLQDTLTRYLNAVQAISSEAEFHEAETVVRKFFDEEAGELQTELLAHDKRNKHTSFISEPWFDMYLKSRLPCPINYNPFMMFASDPAPEYNNQLIRASNFAISCGRFKRALDAECLAPEVFHLNPKKSDTKMFRRVCKLLPSNVSWFGAVAFKAFPLDMSQYPSMFGGNRIPRKGKDELHHRQDARNFLVMRNGHIYTVQLFDENGMLRHRDIIHACLADILRASKEPAKPEECIGSLTTLERDTWAGVREELIQTSQQNLASIKEVDDALFLICLDDLKSEDPTRLIESLLCGDNGSNRWFDKCFQLIIDGNGMATVNFEHSWGDGVSMLRLMEETFKDTATHRFVRVNDRPDSSIRPADYVKKLDWTLTDSLKQKIRTAQEQHVSKGKQLQYGTVEYTKMGRGTVKKYKVSPDSLMQLAIQHAFYRIHKEFVPTYESCSTAAFLKGRTECIRSATLATTDAVVAFEEGKAKDKQSAMELFKKSSDMHTQLVKEASMGQGFDRHLLGLKITAERLNRPIPAFFTDKSYGRMGHFVLSTSSLSSDTIVFGGFGPVVEDGFGIGYNISDARFGAVVTSYKGKRDAQKLASEIVASLDYFKGRLEQA